MTERLQVPKELEHLIEKRDNPDRRQGDRREEMAGPESPEPATPGSSEDLNDDRRVEKQRRRVSRRKSDQGEA